MCVIFFYVNSNPAPGGYKLILASNRDEYYGRETLGAAKWANAEHVYGGIDLEPGREGGTWLAIGGHNGVFKVGALLNLTGEPALRNSLVVHNILHYDHNHHKQMVQQAPVPAPAAVAATVKAAATPTLHHDHFLLGRGMIVSDYVTSGDDCNIESYNAELLANCTKYSAFNFVAIEIGSRTKPARVTLLSNKPPTLLDYEEGICCGFGNSLPTVPLEKVKIGRQRFEAIVDNFNTKVADGSTDMSDCAHTELVTNLNNLLKCKQKFWPDAELLRRAPNWGEHLSALNVYIPHERYGSRTHSIILVDGNDKMHFYEETMASVDPEGEWRKTHIEKQYFQE